MFSSLIFSYFFIVAYALFKNTIKDIKTHLVDERWNYFVYGVSFFFLITSNHDIIYNLIIIFVSYIIAGILGKFMAKADKNILTWILLGMGGIEYYMIIIYLINLVILSILFLITKKIFKGFGQRENAGYPLILGAFLMTYIEIL